MSVSRKIVNSGLCALLGLNSLACSPRDKLDSLGLYSDVQLKRADKLNVNSANIFSTIIKQNEEEGIRQLRCLAMKPNKEEAWLYLAKEKIWVEIGKEATFRSVELNVPYIIRIINEFDDITFYHFHPSERRFLKAVQSTRDALPSSNDINNTIIGSIKFYRTHPKGKYKDRVCSLFGIVETSLTQEGITHFSKFLKKPEYIEEYSRELRKSIDDNSIDCENSLKEIKEMIKRANSNKYIAFKFMPYLE